MARTDLTVIRPPDTGTSLAGVGDAAIADGHMFADNGRRALFVRNTDVSAHTVEVLVPVKIEGLSVGPQVVNVPAGGQVLTGFLTGAYRQSDGKVHVNVPVPTGMFLACVEVD